MFRIYRNLHRGLAFSIQERGRVIDRLTNLVAYDVRFTVSEVGRLRVIRERAKNVHAFVVAQSWSTEMPLELGPAVTYNPYLASTFMCEGESINTASAVIFTGGKCYLAKPNQTLRG